MIVKDRQADQSAFVTSYFPLIMISFLLQGAAISFDEFYFHYERGLPTWERIGHPLDTFSFLICLMWLITVPFSKRALNVYIFLAAFSCFMITKDEFIHKELCCAAEGWLHALLFIMHPINLAFAGIIWSINNPQWNRLIYAYGSAIFLFMIYQVIYWNFL